MTTQAEVVAAASRPAPSTVSDNPTYLAQLELILSDNAQRERPVHPTATTKQLRSSTSA
jgi:hypothetical protein